MGQEHESDGREVCEDMSEGRWPREEWEDDWSQQEWKRPDPLEEERQRLLADSGLAREFWKSTLEPGLPGTVQVHWRLASVVRRLRTWVKDGGVLYVYGDEVRTALSVAAAADCIRKDQPERVRFVAEADYFWLITVRNIRNLRPEFQLSTYEYAEVLVLEGLGVRRLNGYMRDTLFDLFRRRFRGGDTPRKTLLTGRPPPGALEPWLRGEDPSSSGPELVAMFREVIGDERAVNLLPVVSGPMRPTSEAAQRADRR